VAVQTRAEGGQATGGDRWYARTPDAVTAAFGVEVSQGLPAAKAAELLASHGPNALPVEQAEPALRRFLDQYTSYMQIILVGASVVSLVIQQWSTAIVLILITLFNALVGLRQEGKAESAMNALQSMMKATARVRRDGVEAEIPAEQLVPGDVVLIAAGDEVPADGRIVTASALEIDESALTGESIPAPKDAETLSGEIGPGEQSNMAFMHCPVTHGSGVMIVTGTGSDTQVGKIAHMLSATAKEENSV
jgi:P-type Ca2+ transporter type 2C